jgi:hypothetical protein
VSLQRRLPRSTLAACNRLTTCIHNLNNVRSKNIEIDSLSTLQSVFRRGDSSWTTGKIKVAIIFKKAAILLAVFPIMQECAIASVL